MKEFIEKLIGRLEEKFKYNSEQAEIWRYGSDKDAYSREKKDLYMDRANTYGEVMCMVNQLAEEYNNGWIPCSERLPEESGLYLCTIDDKDCPVIVAMWLAEVKIWSFRDPYPVEFFAWKPIASYKPKGE